MSSSAPSTEPLNSGVADAIARAEQRRGVLERITELGMALAEKITTRAAAQPAEVEPRHEPGRAFAGVTRAVRLTLVLEGRIDQEILAMRNGEVLPGKTARGREVAATAPQPDPFSSVVPVVSNDAPCARRTRVRGAVWAAINAEVGDPDEARSALDELHEKLIDGEDYDAVLFRPWRECVEAICADLGLDPDWSGWSDEVGFPPPPPGRPRYDWPRLWAYSPERAKVHREWRAGRAAEDPAKSLMLALPP